MDIHEVCVGDLMHETVEMVSEEMLLCAAARLMHAQGVSSLVVRQEHARDAFGIVTRKDVVEALAAEIPPADQILVKDVMAKPAITVGPELSLTHCLRLMRMAGVRRVPVVKEGRLVGILSNSDVFRWLVEQGECTLL